jgi:murein L,D-transpeptidase YcbB/YkuD
MKTDSEMGWRVLQYNAGLTLQQANSNARVLTFVFYHCRGTGGIRKQRHPLDFYGHSPLAVEYWSVGLGDLDAEPYADSQNPMAWALAAWMRQQRRERVELRLRLLGKILRFVRDEPYRHLLADAVSTYFKLSRTEQAREQRLLQSESYGEVSEMLNTVFGRLEQAAERKALQNALLEVAQSRFPPIPESLEVRIRGVEDLPRLRELIRRAATAATLEEIEPLLEQ